MAWAWKGGVRAMDDDGARETGGVARENIGRVASWRRVFHYSGRYSRENEDKGVGDLSNGHRLACHSLPVSMPDHMAAVRRLPSTAAIPSASRRDGVRCSWRQQSRCGRATFPPRRKCSASFAAKAR